MSYKSFASNIDISTIVPFNLFVEISDLKKCKNGGVPGSKFHSTVCFPYLIPTLQDIHQSFHSQESEQL
uniref:Uncharacterized protein n=1 Tax=Rhizophora mucronata TaxID=61149 RepID=A0A2P2K207_RHIMU